MLKLMIISATLTAAPYALACRGADFKIQSVACENQSEHLLAEISMKLVEDRPTVAQITLFSPRYYSLLPENKSALESSVVTRKNENRYRYLKISAADAWYGGYVSIPKNRIGKTSNFSAYLTWKADGASGLPDDVELSCKSQIELPKTCASGP